MNTIDLRELPLNRWEQYLDDHQLAPLLADYKQTLELLRQATPAFHGSFPGIQAKLTQLTSQIESSIKNNSI